VISPTILFESLLGNKALPAAVAVKPVDELLQWRLTKILGLNGVYAEVCEVLET
jgi:hypothetical protein